MCCSRRLGLLVFTTVYGYVFAGLATQAAIRPLFDGKTLTDWEGDLYWWRVTDGAISGGSLTEKVPKNVFLATTESFQNFDLRLKVRVRGTEGFINSGIQIRSVRVPDSTEMAGYQVDAGDAWWGKLYDESRRNKVIGESAKAETVVAGIKKNDWNDYRILAVGRRIQTWINGVPALDYYEADADIAEDGHIGLQVHGGGKALIEFKDITIEPRPSDPSAPTWEKVGRPGQKRVGAIDRLAPIPRTPQEQLASFRIADGLEIELVASEDTTQGIGKFISVVFDQKGRMWSMTAREYPIDGNETPEAARSLYAGRGRDQVLIFDTPFAPGPQTARTFAGGLAIPLGILPYRDGCYVQHGQDILFLRDTDSDGKADNRSVVLTGFGVEDSHLMPHQFTRAPGDWIWFAQGAFNRSQVRQPDEPIDKAIAFDQTGMARFRPDGSQFEITVRGPCNIWGLVISREGEAFIQEANDYGYPVMPFHEHASYPGCSNRQFKSYAPEFPATAEFRLGGTGLSGLALTDAVGIFPEAWSDVMLVANPITRKINAIKLHRAGPRWRLEQLPDLLTSGDNMFRPVALTLGPDGCVYVTDWYNRIISHNEVARNHPERDKERGRIWRIKPKARNPLAVPDFTTLPAERLLPIFGGPSVAQAHLAWQAITDRQLTRDPAFADALHRICRDPAQSAPRRIQALWALTGSGSAGPDTPQALFTSENRNLRREAVRASTAENGWSLSKFTRVYARAATDPDPEVRAEVIRQLGAHMSKSHPSENGLRLLFSFAQPPLPGPLARSTSRPNTWIKTGDAYDREFERYLVCSFLETHRAETSAYLDSTESRHLSVEARLLGALALEPRQGVLLVAAIIPTLSRPPEAEELFRVAQFADDPATARALVALLEKEESRSAALEAILTYRTQLTSRQLPALLAPFVEPLLRSQSVMELDLGLRLTSGFKITEAEPAVIALIQAQRNIIARTPLPPSSGNSLSSTDSKLHSPEERLLAGIRTLSELGTTHLDLYKQLISTSSQPAVRYEAAVALAGSKDARAASLVLSLWSHLSTPQRRASLDRLLTDESGATAVIAAVTSGTVSIDDLDGVKIERLRALLPANPEAISLDERMNSASRLVLAMDGTDAAQSELGLTLRGAFTAETWMRLEPGDRAIGASDGWIGAPGQAEIHFADSRVRIRLFEPERDVLSSTRSIAPEVWTHLAVTRNDQGLWSLYIDGQLDTQSRAAEPGPLEAIRLGWTSAPGGPKGYFSDLRFWSVCRSDSEIASTFDRQVPNTSAGLILAAQDKATWGKCRQGATLVKTTQVPPVLSIEDSAKLDAKFARFRTLAEKDGDPARGRSLAGICLACHVIGTEGGIIGPNLSGAGSMGLEGLLRSLLTPNAAMESAYQIFRVEMKEGGIFEGFLAQEDSRAIVLRTPGAEDQRIPREKVRNAHYVRRSLMPEGLLEALPPEQVSDLFAYLRALK